jgi:hypothetical protein
MKSKRRSWLVTASIAFAALLLLAGIALFLRGGSRVPIFSTLDVCRITAIREVSDRLGERSKQTSPGVIHVHVQLKHHPDKMDVFRFIYLLKRDAEGTSLYKNTSVGIWFARGDVFNHRFMVLRPSGDVDSLTESEWIDEVAKNTDQVTVVSVVCTTN